MSEFSGRCLCGNVTWRTAASPLWSGHCHCDSCRRASSAPLTSFFGVPRDGVTWTGDIAINVSSEQVQRGFCAACGSQMYYQSTLWPTETHLYAATLEDPSKFQPQAHYHYAERLSWFEVTDDLPKYPGSADGSDPL